MDEKLNSAQAKQNELLEIIEGSSEIKSQRPVYHFATPGGWCNDPNGFSQFENKVHLFYQYHPYSTKWGPMHWGHVTSSDMLHWELQPIALAPETDGDSKGCFSGTAMDDGGKHLIAYTGVSNNGKSDIQNQCVAIGDGTVYKRISLSPVITAADIPFDYSTENFRDPKIWKKEGVYYMACVIKQMNDNGALIMFQSDDARKWIYKGMLDSSKDGLSKMWECPDVLELDGKDILILSPQEMKENYDLGFHDGNNSVYITGKLDYENCCFTRETRSENGYTAAQIDYGIDFYAPETTKLKDGRTIMIGWMQSWESYITPEDYMWSGMMTIPREISFKNGRLHQVPVRELEEWKSGEKRGTLDVNRTENSVKTLSVGPRHFELDLEMKTKSDGSARLILGEMEKEHVVLEISNSGKYISFDRSASKTPGNVPFRKAKIQAENEITKIRILCDTCSIEVFVDDGKMAFTNTFYFSNPETEVTLLNETSNDMKYAFWNIRKP